MNVIKQCLSFQYTNRMMSPLLPTPVFVTLLYTSPAKHPRPLPSTNVTKFPFMGDRAPRQIKSVRTLAREAPGRQTLAPLCSSLLLRRPRALQRRSDVAPRRPDGETRDGQRRGSSQCSGKADNRSRIVSLCHLLRLLPPPFAVFRRAFCGYSSRSRLSPRSGRREWQCYWIVGDVTGGQRSL